jgi:hypothetical protein
MRITVDNSFFFKMAIQAQSILKHQGLLTIRYAAAERLDF